MAVVLLAVGYPTANNHSSDNSIPGGNMFCPECGTRCEVGVNFCMQCSVRLVAHIQNFLAVGTVKSFELKDPEGNVVCEYDDHFFS